MSRSGSREAERQVWQTPELVEGLLPFLDPAATLELALAHKKTRSILKGSRVWKSLIKRSSFWNDDVDHLVAIMKLMKDARGHILDLLVSICDPTSWDYYCNDQCTDILNSGRSRSVLIHCPSHGSHFVSWACFELLERVESAFGTSLQTVGAISLSIAGSACLSAIGPRLSRQRQKLTSSNIRHGFVENDLDAENFKILLQNSPPTTITELFVRGDVRKQGWRSLADVLSYSALGNVSATKETLENGRWIDLRALWNALMPGGTFEVHFLGTYTCQFVKDGGEATWTRLCHLVDMSESELVAQMEAERESDDAVGSDHESEVEDEEWEEEEEEEVDDDEVDDEDAEEEKVELEV